MSRFSEQFERRFGDAEVIAKDFYGDPLLENEDVYYDENEQCYVSESNIANYLSDIGIRKETLRNDVIY
ncbi:hypothetical protein [Staphylococcus felis]|uniref:hypothetical protein n=1 Tax=Staphylococcus felis TaxID=46127 RepID=UPI000CD03791|nr:hypothetical protein [Staphylococcus felis]AVP37445.1 hypothetical protein C7J90_10940 [Staphylococcus felis]PNZ36247.1 hypothetical protein CD143_04580 [Staphylococcus felis]QQB02607.1 hypothetical protein I6H71_07565 [Staphylococcus felis]